MKGLVFYTSNESFLFYIDNIYIIYERFLWGDIHCDRNTAHILTCHLYGASECRQVVMVAPSS